MTLIALALQGIYWLCLFAWLRAFFFVLNIHQLSSSAIPTSDIFAGFWHALPLDLATAAWFLLVPWFLSVLFTLIPWKFLNFAQRAWVFGLTFVYCALSLGESAAYSEWKMKLTYRALTAFKNPSEIIAVSSGEQILGMLALLAVAFGSAIVVYNKFFFREFEPAVGLRKIPQVLALLVATVALGWFARGGFKAIPISLSRVYYSTESILNDAAANPAWHFGFNVAASTAFLTDENPFTFMDRTEAKILVEALHHRSFSTNPALAAEDTAHAANPPADSSASQFDVQNSILNVEKPNIVVVVLESWSADLIESLGGDSSISPEFRKLEQDGLLFSNFYANGNRSQQGIASIFAGFPALPLVAVTDNPAKTKKLPRLAERMVRENYTTSFLYGGQLEYGNIGAFLTYNGFQNIKEGTNFPGSIPRGNMGIHDQYMFDEQIKHMDSSKEPFFTSLFTLSTHSPYDFPDQKDFKWTGPLEENYVRSAQYTDKYLGKFIADARKKPWFKNTLFVLVADHSHNSYRNWPNWKPEYRKIPMLFYGDVLKPEWRGKKHDRIGSHVDIPATLLGLLGQPSTEFTWSKDLFKIGAPEFAYFELNYGFGWITKNGDIVYDKELGEHRISTVPKKQKSKITKDGMAYTQSVFQQFLNL